jgi:toxin FitB
LKYLLDTDVVSQRTKTQPNRAVVQWLQSIEQADTCLSVMTIEEVRAGLEAMSQGAKRRAVEDWLKRELVRGFEGRILPIDIATADECGRIVTAAKKQGHTPSLGDALIAATAKVHGVRVATLNRKDFARLGVGLVEF